MHACLKSIASGILFALCCAASAQAQDVAVTGQVTTRDDGLSLPGATVSIPAFNLSTTTDQEGRYQLTIPAARVTGVDSVDMRVSFTGLPSRTVRIKLTPGTITQDFAVGLAFHEEVTVGSRMAGAASERAVPVDIVTAEQIATTGASETNQIIQTLAPSFNFPRPTITDGTDSVRPATLRGLGPDQVLVLVNGKRRHIGALVHVNGSIGRGSTGADLNAIPASAIERIEILRDGAAAQYGSDAIAGVINIVLKSGVSPISLSAKGGMTTHEDGELLDTSASYGWGVAGGSLFATVEYRDRRETNRAGPDPRDQVVAGDAGRNAVSQPNFHWGDSDARDLMTFANFELPLGNAGTDSFYAFGGISRRTGSHGGFFRRSLEAGNWPQIYPLGFLPLIEPEIVDTSAAAGARGVRSGWFWDVSGQLGYNSFDFNVSNSLNVSLGPTIPPNQTEFYSGSLLFNQFVGNLDVSRQVDVGLVRPINAAMGVEYRRENYEIVAGEPNSYLDGGNLNQFGLRAALGAQVFPGFRPSNEVDESRHSVAVYGDFEGDVLEPLRIGLAGRVERYSDFGSTADGKLTVRFQPDRRFVVRGAFSSGFRAPALGQSYFSAISTNFLNVDGVLVPFEIGTFPVGSPQARVLGAQDLKPEQSLHYSGGIVLEPADRVEITADVYRIDIDDRIVISGNFTGGRISELLLPLGANGARFFTNAVDTWTRGIDVTAGYTHPLRDRNSLRVSGAYNLNRNKVVRVSETPPQLAGFEAVLFDRIERRRIECGQPRNNYRFTGELTGGRIGGILRASRYGEYCIVDRVVVDQNYTPEWITDLEVTYRADRFIVGAGAQNVFDAFPDRNVPANANNGIFPYPSHSPFGMNGRFVYSRVTVQF